MKFLIQTFNKKIVHDFSFTLVEAIRYQQWLGKDIQFRTTDTKLYANYIPVGTVEFVTNYIYKYFQKNIKPINIPESLMSKYFCGRNIINGTNKDVKELKFVKSNDKIKHFTEITDNPPKGNYQISDIIEIESEWRCFVYKDKLVGLQNYSGDFTLFPNISKINEMITAYNNSPISYTLDIGISSGNTIIIEIHNFFSCGLYGFNDYRIYPYMLSSAYYELIR